MGSGGFIFAVFEWYIQISVKASHLILQLQWIVSDSVGSMYLLLLQSQFWILWLCFNVCVFWSITTQRASAFTRVLKLTPHFNSFSCLDWLEENKSIIVTNINSSFRFQSAYIFSLVIILSLEFVRDSQGPYSNAEHLHSTFKASFSH